MLQSWPSARRWIIASAAAIIVCMLMELTWWMVFVAPRSGRSEMIDTLWILAAAAQLLALRLAPRPVPRASATTAVAIQRTHDDEVIFRPRARRPFLTVWPMLPLLLAAAVFMLSDAMLLWHEPYVHQGYWLMSLRLFASGSSHSDGNAWNVFFAGLWTAVPVLLMLHAIFHYRSRRPCDRSPEWKAAGMGAISLSALLVVGTGWAYYAAINPTPTQRWAIAAYAIADGQPEVLDEMCRLSVSNRSPGGQSQFPLTGLAAAHGSKADICILARHGFDFRGPVGANHTALTFATARGSPEIMQALLELGLDVNEPDGTGRTPLHYAAKSFSPAELIRPLLNHGARLDAKDANGCTPLDLLLRWRSEDEVRQLLGPAVTRPSPE
jgi:hypothetical protein